MDANISSLTYLRLLEPWPKASLKEMYALPDRSGLECYGTGGNGWGVQTNQKALAAFAVLAADPELDEERAGISRENLLNHALQMLRFSLESHIAGGYHCTDGTPWGHTWISALGIERMMHGLEAIEDKLTDKDSLLLRRVLLSECDWLLDGYRRVPEDVPGKVTAGRVANNHPESNIWNGSLLHRTATLYPDAIRAEEYREKGNSFLLNGISIAADALSQAILDGKHLAEWHTGANFFDSWALHHHGYLNIGYMVICLSNLAMLFFFFRHRRLEPPPALFHHIEELWQLIRACTFPDGRLLRIGGDTRVRYCYCQDYCIPAWLMLADMLDDKDSPLFEEGWLRTLSMETDANADGTFLSDRCGGLKSISPLYYTRLESDRATAISMGAYWRRILNIPVDAEQASEPPLSHWHDEYHGACLQRSERRIASFVWGAAQPPQGLCLPPCRSDMAEWRSNLTGLITGMGPVNGQKVTGHREKLFKGGFLTWGSAVAFTDEQAGEGKVYEETACQKTVFAALPDDCTVLVMQRATALPRIQLKSVQGMLLQIPNDIYNDRRRTYFCSRGALEIEGEGSCREILDTQSAWLNIDDELGIIGLYGGMGLNICRPGRRQIGIKYRWPDTPDVAGMLYADEICYPAPTSGWFDAGSLLFDIGFVLQSDVSHQETEAAAMAKSAIPPGRLSGGGLKVMRVKGVDSQDYLLLANMGSCRATASLRLENACLSSSLTGAGSIAADKDGSFHFSLDAETAELFQLS